MRKKVKIETVQFSDLTLEQKYRTIIDRLYYSLKSMFKDADDVNDDEIVNTAIDIIETYFEEKDKVKN